MKKVLIIKLGYSETLVSDMGRQPSLGDVLRTTVVLNLFKKENVSWLVDEVAFPLLKNNKYIPRILIYNSGTAELLKRERFDLVLNLEKDRDLCMLADSIEAKKHCGFRYCGRTGRVLYHRGSEEAFRICNHYQTKQSNKKCWQRVIIEMAGGKWKRQKYILGYKPDTKLLFDVGLNWTVGAKWPHKAWPKGKWNELAKLIKTDYTYSWQKGMESIYKYIGWINSCRIIVTADTLGLHIALALGKKVLALFGPTNPDETYLYGLGKKIMPESPYECVPCMKDVCDQKKNCMYYVSAHKVDLEIRRLLVK